MDIQSLNSLIKNGQVYDLYTEVIINDNPYAVYTFSCTNRHNMRIDLVCYDIYNNTNHIDILCIVNGILNPLIVQENDIIYFVDDKNIDAIRSDASVIAAIVDSVKNANKGKQQKTDANRSKDVANRSNNEKDKTFIPPHIIQTQNTNISYGDGVIVLSPNF